ncbi:hypothetical protein DFH06DRAFT_1151880 [Mycena polygramma]|nr:hypothetical protein DFH06DRAFT_1151880 [Mycena polygramma]
MQNKFPKPALFRFTSAFQAPGHQLQPKITSQEPGDGYGMATENDQLIDVIGVCPSLMPVPGGTNRACSVYYDGFSNVKRVKTRQGYIDASDAYWAGARAEWKARYKQGAAGRSAAAAPAGHARSDHCQAFFGGQDARGFRSGCTHDRCTRLLTLNVPPSSGNERTLRARARRDAVGCATRQDCSWSPRMIRSFEEAAQVFATQSGPFHHARWTTAAPHINKHVPPSGAATLRSSRIEHAVTHAVLAAVPVHIQLPQNLPHPRCI